jgi:MFS transporter, MCT family, solute carrier family 16 (monocarboxylic acid transporters), member 3
MSTAVLQTDVELSVLPKAVKLGQYSKWDSSNATISQTQNQPSRSNLVPTIAVSNTTTPGFYDRSDPEGDAAENITSAIPNGGYGWNIVACCATLNFFVTGFSTSWGVLQNALLQAELKDVPVSTVAWMGSLNMAISVAFGLLAIRSLPLLGARKESLLGVIFLSLGVFSSGFATHSVGALFFTYGVMGGCGSAFLVMITNTLPTQYFDGSLGGKLGLANGITKLGGGVGAAVLSIALEAIKSRFGVAWTFRICGVICFAICFPAAWFIRERVPMRKLPTVDLSMFRLVPYLALFMAGAISVFGLFIPAFYLPMFAQTIGLSSSTGAAILSGFNLSAAVGRFGAGPMCDWLGASNTLLITMVLCVISTMGVWPASSSLGPLALFAVMNGVANGAFFTTMPTVNTNLVGGGRAAVAMGMANTGWTFGYLMGPPIAGYLLPKTAQTQSVEAYRPTIFYAGSIAILSCAFVIFGRLSLSKKLVAKV